MAANGYQGALTPVIAGFREFFVTTSAYAVHCKTKLTAIPVVNKTVTVAVFIATALATLVVSFVLVATTSRRSRSKKMEVQNSTNQEGGGGLLQKIKKWKLVKLVLICMEKALNAVEYVITPSKSIKGKESPKASNDLNLPPVTPFNGIPMLLNIRHITKSGDGDTPNNNLKPCSESEWTPFSSVSTTGLDRTSACVSLMDDLSQSTISTPIHDIRQQLVQKIRTWRHAIRDLEGTPEFPSWSPAERSHGKQTKEATGMGRVWTYIASWFSQHPSKSPYSHANGSARKRKRMDGYEDDDISLYLPQHKSQPPRMNGEGLLSKKIETEIPTIRGLSVVPIIGNWFADPLTVNEKPPMPEEDHISLIQHAFLSPSRRIHQPKEHNLSNDQGNGSDTEPYEVLELEQDTTGKSVDVSADQSTSVQQLETSERDLYTTQSSSYSSGSDSE